MRTAIIIIVSFITSLLQLILAPRLVLFGHASPDFIILITSVCALYYGNIFGMVSGLICGFILDIFISPFFGIYSLIYTVFGFFCGYYMKESGRPLEYAVFCTAVSAAASIIRHLIDIFISYILKVDIDLASVFFSRVVPSCIYTVALSVAAVLIFGLLRYRNTGKKAKRRKLTL